MSMLDGFDFHKVCRTCLSTENLKSLYSEYVTQSYFNEILLICTSVECFEKDDLSVLICTNCIWELNRSYKFALKCKDSVRQFKHFTAKYALHFPDYDQNNEISLKEPLESSVLQKEINHELVLIKNEIDDIKMEPNQTMINSSDVGDEVTTVKRTNDDIKVETSLDEPKNKPTGSESCDSEGKEGMQCKTTDNCFISGDGEKQYSCTSTTADDDDKSPVPIRTEDNRFLCTICRNTFAKERELKNHVWLHGGEKPYPCTICNSSFTRMTRLNVHMKRHKNAKQFSCPLCNQKFIKLFFLKSHMRTHTGHSDKAFDQSNALNVEESCFDLHLQALKPYACTICDDSFSVPQHLIVHIQQHSRAKKPYTCAVCNNSFAKAYCLTRHMQTHTGEKPYACTLCDKSFNRKLYLSNHMTARHNDVHCETNITNNQHI